MPASHDELFRLTATEAVSLLKRGDITPLDLIDAAELRIAEVEPAINALPTLCLDRAREHARRLARGEGREAEGEPGWLGGLPVAIKDLADVAGVRTTYGSPIFKDHVPKTSHPVVERIERKGGVVIAKSNTPEFGAGGSTFNEVFGRTRNPWNTALTSGGSTGGGAAALAAGEIWLAHGSDHAGSLRRPATYCSVVGLRPSAGRVTRGTSNNLFAPLSVQGPMARTVADVALFLDTMAGLCSRDPLTFEAPRRSFTEAVASPVVPKRVAFTATFGGKVLVDRETREICAKAVRRFENLGAVVEEAAPDLGGIGEAFLVLRSQHYVVDRELLLKTHRHLIKPDIIWNTERGLTQTPSELAAAERERAALFRRTAEFFETYDLLVSPGGLHACVRCQSAHACRDRRPEARSLSRRLIDYGSDDHDGPAFHCGPVWLRPVRPPGRFADRRSPSRRSRIASGRCIVRAGDGSRPQRASQSATGHCTQRSE